MTTTSTRTRVTTARRAARFNYAQLDYAALAHRCWWGGGASRAHNINSNLHFMRRRFVDEKYTRSHRRPQCDQLEFDMRAFIMNIISVIHIASRRTHARMFNDYDAPERITMMRRRHRRHNNHRQRRTRCACGERGVLSHSFINTFLGNPKTCKQQARALLQRVRFSCGSLFAQIYPLTHMCCASVVCEKHVLQHVCPSNGAHTHATCVRVYIRSVYRGLYIITHTQPDRKRL